MDPTDRSPDDLSAPAADPARAEFPAGGLELAPPRPEGSDALPRPEGPDAPPRPEGSAALLRPEGPDAPPRQGGPDGLSPRSEDSADQSAGAGARARPSSPLAAVGRALGLILLVVMLFVAVGPWLQTRYGLAGVVVLQFTCVLGVPLVYMGLVGLPWRQTLSLRRPATGALIGAVLLGSSLWYALVMTLLALQNLILPAPVDFLEQREALFGAPHSLAAWVALWASAALTPALCEETLFRGVLLSSARRGLGDRRALILVSAMFALFHFNVYQLSITFVLGLVLGWLVIRTGSIFSSMAFHMVNNTMVLLLSQVGDEALPWWGTLLLVAAMLTGVSLIRRASAAPAV